MADRLPPNYPMAPGMNSMNMMNNLMQQQNQQQHQQHQQAQGDSHSGPSFPGIWQQQMQQGQFRPRSVAGMGPQQPQMNDLMPSQNMNRVPSGQQQPMNFPMGVGMPNMGGQQPFHDQQSNQHNVPGGGFGGMSNAALMQAQAAMQQQQQQRNPLLQSLPRNGLSQLEAMRQNHPSHLPKVNPQGQMGQRPDQPQQPNPQGQFVHNGLSAASGDIFSAGMNNEAMRRPSPSHPPNNGMGIIPPNMVASGAGMVNNVNIIERAQAIRSALSGEEAQAKAFAMSAGNRNALQSPEVQGRLKQYQESISRKKEALANLMQHIRDSQVMAQQANGGGGAGSSTGSWLPNSNQGPPFDNGPNFGGRPGPNPSTPLQHHQSPLSQGPQGSPAIGKPQPPMNMMNQAGLPQRTEPPQNSSQGSQPPHLPQQPHPQAETSGSGGPFQMGPMGQTMNPQLPFQNMNPANGHGPGGPQLGPNLGTNAMANMSQANIMNQVQQALNVIQPVLRSQFENSYKAFCARRNMKVNPQSLQVDNRPVDLFQLHTYVMEQGGCSKCDKGSLWDIIGGKLGFVQFPGSDIEPSKSAPGIALQISNIYREFLQQFDSIYISSLLENRNKISGSPVYNSPMIATIITGVTPNIASVGGFAGPSKLALNPQQMTQLISYAHRTVAELRSMNIPDNIIQYIEGHRAQLQRAFSERESFANGIRANQGQNGMMGNNPAMLAGPQLNQDQQQHNGPGPQGNNGAPPGVQPPSFGPVAGGQSQMPDRRPFGQNLAQGGMPNHPGGAFMDGRPQGSLGPQQAQHPSLPQLQQTGQVPQGMNALAQPGMRTTPTREQLQMATTYIAKFKADYTEIKIPQLARREIPPDQRITYNNLLEQLHRLTSTYESHLPLFCCHLKNDQMVQRLIAITCTAAYQRNLYQSGSPLSIVTLDSLRGMLAEAQQYHAQFVNLVRNNSNHQQAMAQRQQMQEQMAQQHQMHNPLALQHHQLQQLAQQQQAMNMTPPPSEMQRNQLGPNIQPTTNIPPPPSAQTHTPHLTAQGLRLPPAPRRNQKGAMNAPTPGGGPGAISSPSPAAASTPTHNAPTPTNVTGSPQVVPKSPKVKPQPKKRVTNARRPSKATPPSNTATAQTPQSQASPESTSTPVQAHATVKRQREEEGQSGGPSPEPSSDADGVANGPSPPKRVKTENSPTTVPAVVPESSRTVVPAKRVPEMASEASNFKTEEETGNFLDQMTELIKLAASNEGQESITNDISETLEMLLKGYSNENGEGSSSGLGIGGDFGTHRETSPGVGASISFDEIFDFSKMPDDEDSKDTPDLVRSSSTNPSPESNSSESDPALHAIGNSSLKTEIKGEDITDVLPPGLWKEIDGGEAAYYQSNDWKWEGHMPALDQPWAIFN